ncbi:DUF3545 family protein [Psychromonas antarctica]|jgi:hypothetical protein|uniref:DUF3545 family protein n=1 Tax=Psychromonas antarctica TaxID=67573 RepID=UPI001EE88E21|nr:DUF3545 family protein [Psychromonas antarctica]MCG6200386.1 DUF3545 family protein [Psychromonas antarctica]
MNMQYLDRADIQASDDEKIYIPKKTTQRVRMWREIEEVKARQKLVKELREIDPSFSLVLADFF